MAMRLRKIAVLPSLLTLGNAFCGFLSIAYAADGQFTRAAWMIFLAMVFDALDGKVARMTGGTSDFGAELDSLSDAITFGVAPAFLVKTLVGLEHSPYLPRVAWGLSAVYVFSAILRLARFNVETDNHDEDAHATFRGLPSPAAAGSVASLVILYYELGSLGGNLGAACQNAILLALPPITVLLGALMISRFRYTHAFNRLVGKRHSFPEFVTVLFVLILAAHFHAYALAALFVGYTVLGPVAVLARRRVRAADLDEADLDEVDLDEDDLEEETPRAELGG